jgi:hypothetical protein
MLIARQQLLIIQFVSDEIGHPEPGMIHYLVGGNGKEQMT